MTRRRGARSFADDAWLAARCLAVDPVGLGGATVRAGPGPLRDAWMAYLAACLEKGAPMRRAPAGIDDERLMGGLDLAATLQAGRPVAQTGVLAAADGGLLVLTLAERLGAGVAARVTGALDRRVVDDGLSRQVPARFAVVALDEGVEPEERPPAALTARLAFSLELALVDPRAPPPKARRLNAARRRLAAVGPARAEILEALVATADALGVEAVTAPLLALRCARAVAALARRTAITAEDAALAARLVLAPRAQRAPPPADQDEEPPPPPQEEDEAPPEPPQDPPPESDGAPPTELLLAAAHAALPPGLLAALADGATARGPPPRGRGAADASKSRTRGRPIGTRPGRPAGGARLHLVDTLRAAAPWQALRARADAGARVQVRREDFRIRRFVQKREASTIFVVDASGSAAVARLAEAKGAVELLLGEAYVARSRVALVAFRGALAEVLLPPTRSLARAKARLAELPGGGGTPLAAGLDQALALALAERRQGRAPLVTLLTDARANIARDGMAGREKATADAREAAAALRLSGVRSVVIDTSPRPQPEGAALAAALGARYVPLPFARAETVRDVVKASTPS